jgi:hypothetical protein
MVGVSSAAFGPSGLWEADAAGAEVELFTGSALLLLLLGALGCGCDFHNHPALLDTVTENAATVTRAITEINSVTDLLFLVAVRLLR